MKTPQTLIAIQEQYVETLNVGIERWAHRPKTPYSVGGGHADRIARGARHKAEKQLRRLGHTDQTQITSILNDARDMAALLRNAREPDDPAA